MKNLTYSLLISLMTATIVLADVNSTFDGQMPPTPDYSLIDGSSCENALTQEDLDAAVQSAVSTAISQQTAMCQANPASCGISIGFTQTDLDTAVQSAVSTAISEQMAMCQANPASCGISVAPTPEEINATVQAAIATAKSEQMAMCLENPASCGINLNVSISPTDVNTLSSGWHLLGTSVDINDTVGFSSAHIVWTFKNDRWSAYSADTQIQTLIINDTSILPLTNVSKNSGFWVLKY